MDSRYLTDTTMKILRISTVVIILFLLQIPVKGFCFSVTAQVDRNSISINESVVLSVVFEDGEAEVDTSSITDFTIASRGSSSNISIINGKYSKSITSTFNLLPKKKGTLKIPPLKVEYDNKIYTTQEITVEVAEQSVSIKTDNSRDIFIESGISATSLFTGQQAIYQLRFYSAVRLSNASLQPPSFKGFTSKEVGERKSHIETINGRPYNVTEINYLILPETPGETEIDPAVIICEVPVKSRRNSMDPFDDPLFSNGFFSFGRTETRQFATEPIGIKVEALPPYTTGNSSGGPDILFSGLVGTFSIDLILDNQKLKVADSGTLTVTISGKGNIMDAQAPHVNVPSDFKVYDDSPEEAIELAPDGYSGKKIFKKAIVPVKAGKYVIEPVALVFFNISTRKYETIYTKQITVDVDNAENNLSSTSEGDSHSQRTEEYNQKTQQAEAAKGRMAVKKKSVEFTGRDILSIKEDTDILKNRKTLSLSFFVTLFFLPWVLFAVFTLFLSRSGKVVSHSEMMLKKARASLKAACISISTEDPDMGKNRDDFFRFLRDALIAIVMSKNTLSDKNPENLINPKESNITTPAITAVTADEVSHILSAAGSSGETVFEVTALLDEIESSRYGSQINDPDHNQKLLKKVEKLFQTLAGIIAVFIPAAVSGFLLMSVSPEKSFAGGTETMRADTHFQAGVVFLEGIKAYRSGDFVTAAEKFVSIANGDTKNNKTADNSAKEQNTSISSAGKGIQSHEGIRNPYLYYNIGNAYIKAGDVGRAILWYERAKKEIPLDPDLRFNIRYARGFVKDRTDESKGAGESSGAGGETSGDIVSGGSGSDDTAIDMAQLLFFWKDYFSLETFQYAAILLSFVFFIYAGYRKLRKKTVFTPAGTIIFFALLVLFLTSLYSYYKSVADSYAVVISKESPVRSGNSTDATQLFILHAGTKVKVEEIKGGYLKILFSREKRGWISAGDAEVI